MSKPIRPYYWPAKGQPERTEAFTWIVEGVIAASWWPDPYVFDIYKEKNIKAVVDHAIGQGIPVLPLKFSRVFDTIFEQERSIRQMMEEDALARYTYREVAVQFDNLLSYLEQHYA